MGIIIISTSKGLMTDRQARIARLGGELICSVWYTLNFILYF